MNRLRAARQALSRTVTPLGWFVLAVTAVSVTLTFSMGLIEFGVLTGLGSILLLIALPYVLGRNNSAVTLELENDRVRVGVGAVLHVTVNNQSLRPSLPSTVEVVVDEGIVQVRIPVIGPKSKVTVSGAIATPKRAVLQIGPATSVRQDPLGLLRRARTDTKVYTLYVHPITVGVPGSTVGLIRDLDGNPTANIVDSDIAFHAVRPYMAGDAQRHIHWKSTAKTGALMVKQFEETKRSRLAILLATTPTEFLSAQELELAVSAAASLATEAIAIGRDTEVLVSPTGNTAAAENSASPSKGHQDRRVKSLKTATVRSALDSFTLIQTDDSAVSLEHLGPRAAASRRDASLVVLVSGSTLTYRQAALATSAFGPDVRVVCVICDVNSSPGVQQIGSITMLRIGVLADLRQLLLRGALQ